MFQRLLVASAASPRSVPVLAEARRLGEIYAARVSLVRVEPRTPAAEARLRQDQEAAGWSEEPASVIWASGDPAKAILKAASGEGADLLVAGALEREGLLTYYVGSVARKIAREAPCSVLLLTEPRAEAHPFAEVVVDTDFGAAAERALRTAADLVKRQGVGRVHVVHDVLHPGLSMALAASTANEGERARQDLVAAREELMHTFLAEVGVRDVPLDTAVLLGRPGFAAAEYAREHGADLLVYPSPKGRSGVLERLFPTDVEWILRDIPCALLLVR